MASGIALRLFRSGLEIVMSDLARPTSIRRSVCFSEAVIKGSWRVEDVYAVFASEMSNALEILSGGKIPVLADDAGELLSAYPFDAVVDARIAKRNLDTKLSDAAIVIGVGPGFTAGIDCGAVIETQRGHYLGRAIYAGVAAENTGIPGSIGGYTVERLLRAPAAGEFLALRDIGDSANVGDTVAMVGGTLVTAQIGGILRGILPSGSLVHVGMKCGDIDPRCERAHCFCASDKALAVGGGVLEALLHFGF